MNRVSDIVPPDASEDELRGMYGDDADEIIAFRRFLSLPQEPLPESEWLDPNVPRRQITIPDDSARRAWLLYMRGRITGKRLMKALAPREEGTP